MLALGLPTKPQTARGCGQAPNVDPIIANNVKDFAASIGIRTPRRITIKSESEPKYAAESHTLELSAASELLPIERRENRSCVGRFRIWRLLIVYATGRFQIGRRLTDHMAAMSYRASSGIGECDAN